MSPGVDWLCGTTTHWSLACHLDVAAIIGHAVFVFVATLVLLVIRHRCVSTCWAGYFQGHTVRWIGQCLAFVLILGEIAGVVVQNELARTPVRIAFCVEPFVAVVAAVVAAVFYNVLEVQRKPGWLCLSAVYWTFLALVKLTQAYQISTYADWTTYWLHLAVVSAFVYCVVLASELLPLSKKCFSRAVLFTPSEADVSHIRYLHPYANFPSKSVFWWIWPILRLGALRPLELSDLGKLPEGETVEKQLRKFTSVYNNEKGKLLPDGSRCPSLWKCYLSAFWRPMMLAAFFRAMSELLSFVGPLSIGVIVRFAASAPANGTDVDAPASDEALVSTGDFFQNGYVMAVVVFLATIVQTVFTQAFMHISIVEGIHLRSAIQALVFQKAVTLPAWLTSGQGQDAGSIVNYVSSDAYNLMMFFFMFHFLWAIPIKVIALLVLLYRQLGYSSLLGTASMFIFVPLMYSVGNLMSKNQKSLLTVSDVRIGKTNEILQGIRQLKLYGWEFLFSETITMERRQELKYLYKDHLYWILNLHEYCNACVCVAALTASEIVLCFIFLAVLTHASTVFVTLVTFACFSAVEERALTADHVFSGLALFSQLAVPLFIFPITVPIVISAMVSTKRLMAFFEVVERNAGSGRESSLQSNANASILMSSNTGSIMMNVVGENTLENDSLEGGEEEEEEEDSHKDGENFSDLSDAAAGRETARNGKTSRLCVGLEIVSGQFSWKDEPVLKDISISVGAGQLTAVVGGVGSGKSSLLLALLGEMRCLSGHLHSDQNMPIAYVPQKPWLLNATIRDNILFGRTFIATWYSKVLTLCSLQLDLDLMPLGDDTEIGEKGVTLSGGQKQRIALARAIYCKAPILILDDPTSALDAQVSLRVFETLLYLVHGKKRSVVIVTNRIQFLPRADKIVVLEKGRVRHYSSFMEIICQDPSLNESWLNTIKHEDRELSEGQPRELSLLERRRLKRTLTLQMPTLDKRGTFGRGMSLTRQVSCDVMSPVPFHDYGEEGCELLQTPSSPPTAKRTQALTSLPGLAQRSFQRMFSVMTTASEVPSEAPIDLEDVGSKLLAGEDLGRGKISSLLYTKYISSCGVAISILFLLSSVVVQALSVGKDFWLSEWSQSYQHVNETDQDNSSLGYYLVGYTALSFASIFATLFAGLVGLVGGHKAVRVMHADLLNSVVRAPVQFFDVNPIGRILNRFSSDVGVIDKNLQITIQTLVRFILHCLSAIVVNAIVTPYFLLVTIPIFIVYYFIQRYFRFTSRELQRLDSLTKSPLLANVTETLSGLTTIRAFWKEKLFMTKMLVTIDTNSIAFLMMNSANRWLGIALDSLGGIIVLCATVISTTAAIYGHVSPAFVGLAITYTLLVPVFLNWVVRHLADMEMYMSAVERVNHYCQLPQEKYNEGKAPPDDWPPFGALHLQDVSLRYSDNFEATISKMSLSVTAGEKLGICGRTGSGKSSLAMSLFRMIDKFEGSIIIDDLEVDSIPLLALRSSLSIIPQDCILFTGSLRWNLDPHNRYLDGELWNALEMSQMKSVVQSLPGKLDAMVDLGGENFSAGQKQLLCLARAILCKSKVLVMDEATATLDEGMDSVLQEVISKAFHNRTVLTIAHHVSTILNYDTIVVLDRGTIVEYGPPKELIRRPNGIFASLLKSAYSNESNIVQTNE